jgi:HNH endonuclease
MPYKLVEPIEGRWSNFRVRGTERGIYIDRTTGTDDREEAKKFLEECKIEACRDHKYPDLGPVVDALKEADESLPAEMYKSRYLVLARAAMAAMVARGNGEEWRSVIGCQDYEVSSSGNVRKILPGGRRLVLSPTPMRSGHLNVSVYSGKKQIRTSVHRLVCRAFNGPPPFPGAVVRHWNGIPDDNRPKNLMWGTHLENSADMMRHRAESVRLIRDRKPRRLRYARKNKHIEEISDGKGHSLGKGEVESSILSCSTNDPR